VGSARDEPCSIRDASSSNSCAHAFELLDELRQHRGVQNRAALPRLLAEIG
jgi:hypothetical protein